MTLEGGSESRANLQVANDAVNGLRSSFASGRTMDRRWQRRQVQSVLRALRDRGAELVDAVREDLSKDRTEAWLTEVFPVISQSTFILRHHGRWARRQRVNVPARLRPGSAYLESRPRGVVAVIGAWNYPAQLLLSPLVGALAAGNCVVLKPSERAPATAAFIKGLLLQTVDPDAVVVLEGDGGMAQAVVRARPDLVLFTGSRDAGRSILRLAAEDLTPVVLELGGKSPAVVCADAPIQAAARRIAWGKLVNAGQTCIAPDYVIVEARAATKLVDALVTEFEKAPIEGCRVSSTAGAARLDGLLADHGGTVMCGGQVDIERRLVQPTVVLEPAAKSALMTEEIFGPVLPVLVVDTAADALALIKDRPDPLAAYLFTSQRSVQREFVLTSGAGGVCINHVLFHALIPALPFGGVGQSGMGAYHGRSGYEAFVHRVPVHRRWNRPDPAILYPPYSAAADRFLRAMFR